MREFSSSTITKHTLKSKQEIIYGAGFSPLKTAHLHLQYGHKLHFFPSIFFTIANQS